LKEFRSRREAKNKNHYGKASGDEAQAKGYMSHKIFATIKDIESPDINPEDRKKKLATLAQAIIAHNGDGDTPAQEMTPRQKTKRRVFMHFGTFAAVEHARQLEFSVNDMLAFLQFPIGLDSSNRVMLRGLYDTGGCCNMGWKLYHLEIAQKHPKLVKQVLELESVQYEKIQIGGIKDGVEIDTLIEYYIPHQDHQNDNHTMMIGLTDSLPINTLYGLPFIIKAKLVPSFHRRACTSEFFKEEYELNMERPGRFPIEHLHWNVTPTPTYMAGHKETRFAPAS